METLPPPAVVPLATHDLSAQERLSVLKESVTGFMLCSAGLKNLHAGSPAETALAVVDIAVGAALVVIGMVELKGGKMFGHSVRWFDIFAGGLLVAEGVHFAIEGHHHVQLWVGYIVAGLLNAGVGLSHARIASRRVLKLDEREISYRANLFRRFRLGWGDVRAVRVGERTIEIATANGRTCRIRRRHTGHWEAVVDRLTEHARAHGVEVLDSQALASPA